ncbi:hypothetical protein MP228_000659 [Amoeboaphelidium protococcarum]|nr:hypothetical protein MP228_000659 [Amoeboaphelidium protococcarum]
MSRRKLTKEQSITIPDADKVQSDPKLMLDSLLNMLSPNPAVDTIYELEQSPVKSNRINDAPELQSSLPQSLVQSPSSPPSHDHYVPQHDDQQQQHNLIDNMLNHHPTLVHSHVDPYYDMISVISHSQTAEIQKARHVPTGSLVAIKRIQKVNLNYKEVSLKLYREIYIHQKLKHQNIARIMHVYDRLDDIFIVMDYGECDLFKFIEQHKPVGEDVARSIFRQLIAAVAYCHERDVVHRDIKPDNVIICYTDQQHRNYTVKLIDFGFTNVQSPNEQLDEFCGSVEYCAPELLARKPYDGRMVDIWALGVTLYCTAEAQLPFSDSNMSKLVGAIVTGRFKVPDYFTSMLSNLVKGILTVDVAKRLQMKDVVEHEWINIGYDHQIPLRQRDQHLQITDHIKTCLVDIGYSEEDISHCLTGDPSPVFTSFYLLSQRFNDSDRSSIAENKLSSLDEMKNMPRQLPSSELAVVNIQDFVEQKQQRYDTSSSYQKDFKSNEIKERFK